jgi:DNA-binding transcriptional regulator YdaS (Cro superfamily)
MKEKTVGQQVTQDLLQWSVPRLIGAGYGLFSKKAANPRWPEFFITAFVIKKYREKSSFLFMIRHALKGVRKHEIVAGELKAILARLIGSKPRDLHQLSGIYRGLMAEKGPAIATAAIVEVIRTTNQKRTQKLSWLRREPSTPALFQTPLREERKKKAIRKKIQKKSKSHH